MNNDLSFSFLLKFLSCRSLNADLDSPRFSKADAEFVFPLPVRLNGFHTSPPRCLAIGLPPNSCAAIHSGLFSRRIRRCGCRRPSKLLAPVGIDNDGPELGGSFTNQSRHIYHTNWPSSESSLSSEANKFHRSSRTVPITCLQVVLSSAVRSQVECIMPPTTAFLL